MKYRKKPVVIEAFQWTGDPEQKEDPEWMKPLISDRKIVFLMELDGETPKMHIETDTGTAIAHVGDYIIKGIEGEVYPCSASVFEATYDPAE